MALGLTQPLTKMITMDISWGSWRPVRRADNLTTLKFRFSRNFGSLKLLEPYGPDQTCKGISLPLSSPLYTSKMGTYVRFQYSKKGSGTKTMFPSFVFSIKKVKFTLVQALRLYTGSTVHRGSRGIALLFYYQRHYKGVRGQRHAPAAFNPRERLGTHFTRGWVGPRAGLDRCGKSRPHRDSIPGLPSQSLVFSMLFP